VPFPPCAHSAPDWRRTDGIPNAAAAADAALDGDGDDDLLDDLLLMGEDELRAALEEELEAEEQEREREREQELEREREMSAIAARMAQAPAPPPSVPPSRLSAKARKALASGNVVHPLHELSSAPAGERVELNLPDGVKVSFAQPGRAELRGLRISNVHQQYIDWVRELLVTRAHRAHSAHRALRRRCAQVEHRILGQKELGVLMQVKEATAKRFLSDRKGVYRLLHYMHEIAAISYVSGSGSAPAPCLAE
jgi:hypothetical protein